MLRTFCDSGKGSLSQNPNKVVNLGSYWECGSSNSTGKRKSVQVAGARVIAVNCKIQLAIRNFDS